MNDIHHKSSHVSIVTLYLSFLRLGLTAFGGPAMVAYIRELSVKKKGWLNDDEFRNGIALVQSIPGATAMQMAGYVGLKLCGTQGALSSFSGFATPAFLLMLAFSALYAATRQLPSSLALFSGLQVIVVAIVANAVWTFGRDIVRKPGGFLIGVSAASLLWMAVSPFIVIPGAAVAGIMIFRQKAAVSARDLHKPASSFPWSLAALVLTAGAAMTFLYGFRRDMFTMAALLMRIDLFAFGGGFTSLPLMLHEVVDVRQWLDYETFMDGIALGQVTPGPIVITSTFVGYQLFGLPGAVTATMAMLTPSFLIMVGVSPFFDKLKSSPLFGSAISGVLASFVGLLLFVLLKFAAAVPWEAFRVMLGLAALAALLKKVDVLYVVLAGAAVSLILFR